jgi:Homeodomain-like domain
MPRGRIAEVVFIDPDTVRDAIHNFNRNGFDALYPRYRGGRPRTFTLHERQRIKQIALSVPTDVGAPFATWSLAKLADYLVAGGGDATRPAEPSKWADSSSSTRRGTPARRERAPRAP